MTTAEAIAFLNRSWMELAEWMEPEEEEALTTLIRTAARYDWLRKFWVELYNVDPEGHPLAQPKIALSATTDALDELIDNVLAAAPGGEGG